MDRYNHDLAGADEDSHDADDSPLFGSFNSYSPQYRKQQSCSDRSLSGGLAGIGYGGGTPDTADPPTSLPATLNVPMTSTSLSTVTSGADSIMVVKVVDEITTEPTTASAPLPDENTQAESASPVIDQKQQQAMEVASSTDNVPTSGAAESTPKSTVADAAPTPISISTSAVTTSVTATSPASKVASVPADAAIETATTDIPCDTTATSTVSMPTNASRSAATSTKPTASIANQPVHPSPLAVPRHLNRPELRNLDVSDAVAVTLHVRYI